MFKQPFSKWFHIPARTGGKKNEAPAAHSQGIGSPAMASETARAGVGDGLNKTQCVIIQADCQICWVMVTPDKGDMGSTRADATTLMTDRTRTPAGGRSSAGEQGSRAHFAGDMLEGINFAGRQLA